METKPLTQASGGGKILLPLSLSEKSNTSLRVAWNLARESKSRLVLLHVVQLNIAGEEHGIPRARLMNELCREAQSRLGPLSACLGEEVETEAMVCEGRPAEAIVETARRLQTDAIVLSAKERHSWLNRLRPDIASAVSREAPCHVMVVCPVPEASAKQTNPNRRTSRRSFNHWHLREVLNPFRSLFRVLFS